MTSLLAADAAGAGRHTGRFLETLYQAALPHLPRGLSAVAGFANSSLGMESRWKMELLHRKDTAEGDRLNWVTLPPNHGLQQQAAIRPSDQQ